MYYERYLGYLVCHDQYSRESASRQQPSVTKTSRDIQNVITYTTFISDEYSNILALEHHFPQPWVCERDRTTVRETFRRQGREMQGGGLCCLCFMMERCILTTWEPPPVGSLRQHPVKELLMLLGHPRHTCSAAYHVLMETQTPSCLVAMATDGIKTFALVTL